MRKITVIVVLLVLCACLLEAKDFVTGTRVNNLLVLTDKVKYRSLPLLKRDKDYTYTDPKQRVIKGIIARDLSRTDTEVTITEGGVGETHVSLHFQSGRGDEINYLVLIFTKDK